MPHSLASCLSRPTGPSDNGGQALEGPNLSVQTNGFLKWLTEQGKKRKGKAKKGEERKGKERKEGRKGERDKEIF